ncbi:TnsA endonuclease N-terminal domain-containing protein [Variovorax ureilyticus]|uniref:TnsA endonuclease N-terminal domain-containing protein n=1 Tax=Variovorax ureilyticus TaxID=1836198 RepID=UPI003D6792C3
MATRRYSPRPGLKRLDIGIRKTAPTFGRSVFLTDAQKSIGAIAVESPSERLISQLLGLDPTVRTFQSQPLTVDLLQGTLLLTSEEKAQARQRDRVRGERSVFYTPDFLVQLCSGASIAIEVKTEDWNGDAAYQEKLFRASEVLACHRIDFARLVVPSLWCHPLKTNAPLLHQAAKRLDLRPTAAVLEKLEVLADGGACTLGEFCSGIGVDMRTAPVLIVFGALKADVLKHELNSKTPAQAAYGDLSHLSVLGGLAQ